MYFVLSYNVVLEKSTGSYSTGVNTIHGADEAKAVVASLEAAIHEYILGRAVEWVRPFAGTYFIRSTSNTHREELNAWMKTLNDTSPVNVHYLISPMLIDTNIIGAIHPDLVSTLQSVTRADHGKAWY